MGIQQHLQSSPLLTLIIDAQSSSSDDSPAMNEIIRRFDPLARRLGGEIAAATPHLFDDIANACRLGLVRAVRRHDRARHGFPKYAARFMRGAGLREIKRWQKELPSIPVDAIETPDHRVQPSEIVLERIAPWGDGAVAEAVADLSESQRRILTLRYVEDAPLGRIAQESGTSVPAVSQRVATIHRAVAQAVAA